MKFIGFDGKEYKEDINFFKYKRRSEEECRSNYQFQIGNVLEELFEYFLIVEEFPIGDGLKLDFLIPNFKICVEADGAQHDSFNKFYHTNAAGFRRQQLNDKKKEEWAALNNLILIRIKYPETSKVKIMNLIYDAITREMDKKEGDKNG